MIALHVLMIALLVLAAASIFVSAVRSQADRSDDVFEDMRQVKQILAYSLCVVSAVYAIDKLSSPVGVAQIAQMAALTAISLVSAGAALLFDPEASYPEYFARDGRGDVA